MDIKTKNGFQFTNVPAKGERGVAEIGMIYDGRFSFAHVGWSAPVLFARGAYYVAAEIVAAISADRTSSIARLLGGVRYGRRAYVPAEAAIEACGTCGAPSREAANGRSDRERDRAVEVYEFGTALLELVTS